MGVADVGCAEGNVAELVVVSWFARAVFGGIFC